MKETMDLKKEQLQKLNSMTKIEVHNLIESTFTDAVCKEGERICAKDGVDARDKFFNETFSLAIDNYVTEDQRRVMRERIQSDIKNRPKVIEGHEAKIKESAGETLSKITIKKIIEGKISGQEISYTQALIAAQQENPELALKVKAEMDEIRNTNVMPPRGGRF